MNRLVIVLFHYNVSLYELPPENEVFIIIIIINIIIWDSCILLFETHVFYYLRIMYFIIWDSCILLFETHVFYYLRLMYFIINIRVLNHFV